MCYSIGRICKLIIFLIYGILVGFDYGCIWLNVEDLKKWYNDFGGGIWINGINVIMVRVFYFKLFDEIGRVVIGVVYSF